MLDLAGPRWSGRRRLPDDRSSTGGETGSSSARTSNAGVSSWNVDLLREAEHPCLLAAFPHTKRVITHRLRITDAAQLDDALAGLVVESYE